ncbi:porin family protein [candidate division KSB1 bacterium]
MRAKILVIVLVLFLVPGLSQAQLIKGWGFTAGYTTTDVKASAFEDSYKNRTGMCAGIYIEWLKIPFISVITQAEYTQKGFREEQVETDILGSYVGTATAETRLDYISLPILAKFRYPSIVIEPYFVTGPRFDFLINHDNGSFDFNEGSVRSEIADYFTDKVYGWTFGGGLTLPQIFNNALSLEIDYNIDFTDSFDHVSEVLDMEVKNRTFDVRLRLIF